MGDRPTRNIDHLQPGYFYCVDWINRSPDSIRKIVERERLVTFYKDSIAGETVEYRNKTMPHRPAWLLLKRNLRPGDVVIAHGLEAFKHSRDLDRVCKSLRKQGVLLIVPVGVNLLTSRDNGTARALLEWTARECTSSDDAYSLGRSNYGTLNEQELDTVRYARLLQKRGRSSTEIAALLARKGVKTRRGTSPTHQTVRWWINRAKHNPMVDSLTRPPTMA